MCSTRSQILDLLIDIKRLSSVLYTNHSILLRRYGRTDLQYRNWLTGTLLSLKGQMRHTDGQLLSLYRSICSHLYQARNITADSGALSVCLSDLDSLIQAGDDHNGLTPEIEGFINNYNNQKRLLVKYNIK